MSNAHANDENNIITVKGSQAGDVPATDVGGSLVGRINDHGE